MQYLLDTNCCIYLLAGSHPALTARVERCAVGEVAISAIVYAEVALGTAHGKSPDLAGLAAFVGQVPVLPFDYAAGRAYAGLPFRRGRFDRLLAAHALSLDATVITNNEADFADIPGLKIENWTLPL
ncbi:type II toxin-antitoxin system VapC family toxin [Sphingomonas flavalba]|uniref:type II toxin-antitoxin system VapC family toxin n=1 Tax=Sphingomonas flavalba TaxID=2559804 RepID=UPI0039E076ED